MWLLNALVLHMLLLFGGLLLPYVRVNRTRAPKCRIFRPLVHFVCNCVLICIKLCLHGAKTLRIPASLLQKYPRGELPQARGANSPHTRASARYKALRSNSVKPAYPSTTQAALRFSKNAAIPSWASSPSQRATSASMVLPTTSSSMRGPSSRAICLAAATAPGAHAR